LNKEDFTFVITTFKSEKVIFDCIKNIPDQCSKIVIENSNNNQLKNDLEKKFPNLECYVMKDNLGYGKANNFGIKKSKTKYVFIINPDVILNEKNFNEILELLKNEKFTIAAPIEDISKIDFEKKKILEVEDVKGFAMIINTQNINAILFDENIFLYLEEIDLCKRVRAQNGRILLLQTKIKHLGGLSHGNSSDIEMENSRNWHWMWSKFYYLKKHNGYFFALIKTLPNLLSSLFKILFYGVSRNKKNFEKYKMRLYGLVNSYFLKKSYYRPYTKKKYN
tara:strand:+ start:955 stop:1791 length:837 start_codon:yes stop_codon:yes gene_type:complete